MTTIDGVERMPYDLNVPGIGDTVYFRLGEANTLDDVRNGTVVMYDGDGFTVVHQGYDYHVDCKTYEDSNPSWSWTKNNQYARLAADTNTPASVLVELMHLHVDDIDWELAGNPNTPREVLLHLAENINTSLCVSLAENPNSDVLILEHVLGSKQSGPAYAILAMREDLPDYMYRQLVETGIVLTHLATNKAVPVQLLIETMAKSKSIAPSRKEHIVRDILAVSKKDEYVNYVRTILGEDALSMPESWQFKAIGCA